MTERFPTGLGEDVENLSRYVKKTEIDRDVDKMKGQNRRWPQKTAAT
jgi:hypothetical protein